MIDYNIKNTRKIGHRQGRTMQRLEKNNVNRRQNNNRAEMRKKRRDKAGNRTKIRLRITQTVPVRDGHGGGWSRKINAWHLYTLMVYL